MAGGMLTSLAGVIDSEDSLRFKRIVSNNLYSLLRFRVASMSILRIN